MTAQEQIADEIVYEQKRPVLLKHRLAIIQAKQQFELNGIAALLAAAESLAGMLKPDAVDYAKYIELQECNRQVNEKIFKLENPVIYFSTTSTGSSQSTNNIILGK